MHTRTQEEELAYRRALRRKARRRIRRRKVMIARAIVIGVLVLVLVLIGLLIRVIYHSVMTREVPSEKVEQTVVTPVPTLEYAIPEGMEEQVETLETMRSSYPDVENILLNLYQYNDTMLQLAIDNPETIGFVVDYPRHKSDTFTSGKLTQKELSDGIPMLMQWDERWGYLAYGNNIVAIDGCGPTCLSMVVSGLRHSTKYSPAYVADFSTEHNFFSTDAGSSWSLMSTGAEKLGVVVHNELSAGSVGLDQKIIKQLKKGRPFICSMLPGTFSNQNHFIVLCGLTEEGQVIVHDPASTANSEQSWDLDVLMADIKAIWYYSVN